MTSSNDYEMWKKQQEENNGTTPEQPPPVGLNMQINPQGVVLSFPVNLGIDNATMAQLIRAYLQAYPDLLQELARESIAQKQQELAFIEMVQRSKNNGG